MDARMNCPHKRPVTPEGRYAEWVCLDCGAYGKVSEGKLVVETHHPTHQLPVSEGG